MLARRGCLDFVLFSSLNKALFSCGLLSNPVSCYIRCVHMPLCCGLVSLTLWEQCKTKCLSDRMSWVHHRQEMKFTLLPTQQLSALLTEKKQS